MSENTEALINKYRPADWDEYLGNDPLVESLKVGVAKGTFQTVVLTGPSGCGKTTLARIAARHSGCDDSDIQEIDGATYAGVGEMREVTKALQYRPLSKTGRRAVILDECHRLSAQAWDSLLKSIEEPPDWLFWFLCTTEPQKLPKTILTRSATYSVKPADEETLVGLLENIVDSEKLKVKDVIISMCVSEAGGSPRQAISNLAVCATCKTAEEAAELLRSATDSKEAVDLARFLVKGGSWSDAVKLIKALGEMNPESIRHVVRSYVTAVTLNAKSEDAAIKGLEILQAFATPFNSQDGMTPVVLAVGRALFAPG